MKISYHFNNYFKFIKFAINRLKCLQELMKYKDLFFDQENFNQENAKAFAFVS
jgi:hypothetical protein